MSTSIGLTKSKLQQSSIKTTVSRSIAGATRSTGASSTMSTNKSIFATNFGIYAQRTSKGSGRHFSYLGYNDEQTWALRHSRNDSRTPVFNNIIEGYPHYHEDNSNKGLGIAMGVGMGLGAVLTGIAALKEAGIIGKKEVVTDGKVELDSVSDSDPDFKGDTSALSAMSSANDSTTLRAAIETARYTQDKMESSLSTLEGELQGLGEASEAATERLKTLEPDIKAKEDDVQEKEGVVSEKTEALNSATRDRDSKLQVAKNMETAVGEAATNYTKASEALVNAEATLASTPKTITELGPDGTPIIEPNPDYNLAQLKVQQAKDAKDQAKQKLDAAKEQHKQAVENYEKSITAYENAAEEVQTAKKALEEAKTALEEAQDALNKLKDEESKANSIVKNYNDKLKQKESLESNINKYNNEIEKQRKRLTEMEKNEANDLTKVGNRMNELAGKIDGRNKQIDTSDGLNFREKMKMKRNERNSEEYERLSEKQKELEMRQNYTKLSNMVPEKTGSDGKTQFRKAEFGGETLYMIGARPVTEQEYNEKLQELGLS